MTRPKRSLPAGLRSRSWLTAIALAGIAALFAWRPWAHSPGTDRVYRIGLGGDVPMHYLDENGRPTGLAVEIVQAAAKRQGIALEWVDAQTLGGSELDMWVLKSVIPGQSQGLHLTEPYLQAESCFLVPAASSIRDVPDLRGKRVSYIDYLVHRVTLPQILDAFEPVPLASSREAVDALLDGRADAAYIDQYTLFATLLRGEGRPLRVLPTRSPTRDMALAARPPSAAVADRLRDGMRELAEDGTLEELMRHWIFFPNLTSNIIGDTARERRQNRWLLTGLALLGTFSIVTLTLFIVAQRRKNELRRSERDYRSLHESMSEAFVRFDVAGRIIEANRAFCDLLRTEPPDLLGRAHSSLTPVAWREQESRIHRDQVLNRGFSDVYEKEYQRPDGSTLPVELRVFLLRNSAGRPEGHWAIVRDISERKHAEQEHERLQQQLAQSQKLEVVGQLAGGVAHDYNNMLQAILGNASIALAELPPDHPVREYVDEIQSSANRSAALTRQLLTFARRQPTTPRVLDLNLTITTMLKLLRRLIGEDVDLRWQPAEFTWPVRIDPHQTDQVLTNLCLNARDALQAGGTIVISTRNLHLDPAHAAPGAEPRAGDFVVLTVSDNGSGISQEDRLHLFEPFFTTKPAGKGTGLGLATLYGIVRQNNGFITVDSEPGRGSTFSVHLPRHTEAAAAPTPPAPAKTPTPSPAAPTGGTETILLVEDEEAVRRVAARQLGNLGYRILESASADDARRHLRDERETVDLLLTDVVMPGINGLELARELIAVRPGLRCLFMSGYTEHRLAEAGAESSAHHFLAKPFTTDSLSRAIRRALDQPPRRA